MPKDATYSPTVCYSYRIDEDWWYRLYPRNNYDCQGYDEYGYDKDGRDRAWKKKSDYEKDSNLYEEMIKDFNFLIHITGYEPWYYE